MNLLVISGGRHPYAESTPALERFLQAGGHRITTTEDASILADAPRMAAFDALVFNTRRENLPDFGDWALQPPEREGLKSYIASGKGFICLHIAGCVPQEWPEYHEITGGGWITGTSYHPPYGAMRVNISDAAHACCSGLADFDTTDELYMNVQHFDAGNEVFITGDSEGGVWPWGPERQPTAMPGGTYPLGWTRRYGAGKVFVLLLGHDGASFAAPGFQQLVLNGVEWATAA